MGSSFYIRCFVEV